MRDQDHFAGKRRRNGRTGFGGHVRHGHSHGDSQENLAGKLEILLDKLANHWDQRLEQDRRQIGTAPVQQPR